jgi:hypothetical protein
VVDDVALEHGFFSFFSFTLLIIIPVLFSTYSALPHELCDSRHQVAHCLIFSFFLSGASSFTWQLSDYKGRKLVYMNVVDTLKMFFESMSHVSLVHKWGIALSMLYNNFS